MVVAPASVREKNLMQIQLNRNKKKNTFPTGRIKPRWRFSGRWTALMAEWCRFQEQDPLPVFFSASWISMETKMLPLLHMHRGGVVYFTSRKLLQMGILTHKRKTPIHLPLIWCSCSSFVRSRFEIEIETGIFLHQHNQKRMKKSKSLSQPDHSRTSQIHVKHQLLRCRTKWNHNHTGARERERAIDIDLRESKLNNKIDSISRNSWRSESEHIVPPSRW